MKSNPAGDNSPNGSGPADRGNDGGEPEIGNGHAVGFQFAFSPAFRIANMATGVCPSNSSVIIDGDSFRARFGSWRVVTPLSNIAGAEVTGPYSWPKVIGGPHLSAKDRGLTFGTNTKQGVCISFHEPVKGMDPWGLLKHPGLTVTVADPAALAELLEASSGDMRRTHGSVDQPEDIDSLREEVDLELQSLTAAELRARAAERGIERTSRMSKAELIEALEPKS